MVADVDAEANAEAEEDEDEDGKGDAVAGGAVGVGTIAQFVVALTVFDNTALLGTVWFNWLSNWTVILLH